MPGTKTKSWADELFLDRHETMSLVGTSYWKMVEDGRKGLMPKWVLVRRRRMWLKEEIEAWVRYGRPKMSEWDRSVPPPPLADIIEKQLRR